MNKLKGIRNRIWLFINIGCTIIYLLWRTFFTLPFEYGWVALVAGIVLLVVEVIGMFEAFVHYFNMHRIESHDMPEVPLMEYPDVDVFIATYNEPIEILYKTVNGCVHMEYPDKKKVHIYICDDGHRSEVKEFAKRMGVGYIDREDNEGAKAGNLNHAMSLTSSPVIATFDADMIPRREFLMVTAAYFVDQWIKNRELEEDEQVKLGFIQTPQSFYNLDLFQFNLFSEERIPNEQDYFYKDVQIARNKSNCVIYGGSNTLISREALEAVGGFYTKSITEDFATGILIQKKGYICYAINQVLASGLSPTDLKSLINQRIRWGRGCIQTGRKMHLFFSRHLSIAQKANYIASIWYWYASWKRLVYILSPILFATFNVVVVKCNLMQVLIFWLPMYISSNISLKMMSRNIRTTKWTNLYETVIFPFMLIPILLESFGIRMKKFKVTQKEKKEDENGRLKYALPHILLIVLSVIGIVKSILWTFETGKIDYFVMLFWLLTNLFNLVMALFFVMGRKVVRNAERQKIDIPCEIETRFEKMIGNTMDISEGGIRIKVSLPCDISEEEPVAIRLDSSQYKAEVEGRIVSVKQVMQEWEYVFAVVDYKESKAEYFQIIYDREPSLPKNLDESLSGFDDLRLNLQRRMQNTEFHNRKKARIIVEKYVDTDKKNTRVFMYNFNYDFVLLKTDASLKEKFSIILSKSLVLKVGKLRDMEYDKCLYKVMNAEEIYENAIRHADMAKWVNQCINEVQTEKTVDKVNYKKQRMSATDEFSELDYL